MWRLFTVSQNAYCGLRKNTVHKHYSRMKYEGIEVKLPTFLTLAVYIEMSG